MEIGKLCGWKDLGYMYCIPQLTNVILIWLVKDTNVLLLTKSYSNLGDEITLKSKKNKKISQRKQKNRLFREIIAQMIDG